MLGAVDADQPIVSMRQLLDLLVGLTDLVLQDLVIVADLKLQLLLDLQLLLQLRDLL